MFNYDELRATIFAYFIVTIKCIAFLSRELKDGDVAFYLENIGTIPNHNPLTFGILNTVHFFVQDKLLVFAMVELVAYVSLYLCVLICLNVVFSKEKYYYLPFFILIYLSEAIYYGSPLKEVLGLVWFFIFFSYFHQHKETIKQKLPFICMFLFLAFITHVVAFMFCLVLLISYFLLKNKKVAIGIICFTTVFVVFFSVFKEFFSQTVFQSFYKLEIIARINMNTITASISRLGGKNIYLVFVLVYIIFVVGVIFYRKKINYVDVFVLIISTYFIFGSYAGDFFFRFMSLLPFVLVFGLSSIIQKIYDNRPKKDEGKLDVEA